MDKQNVLLTGKPGIGKTTVIIRLAERLQPRTIHGFYTEEIRSGGQRQGFRVATFSGGSAVLAHVNLTSRKRVGRYGVDVTAFEQLVLPELAAPADIMLIDEIGKMECFSTGFVSAIRRLLDAHIAVVATVATKGGGLITEAKARCDVDILQVTSDNRDELPQRLVEVLSS